MWPNSCERVTCSQETADLAVSSATTRSLLYSHEPSYEWEYAQQRTKLWNFKYDFISNVRFEWNKSMFPQVKEGLTEEGMESQFFNCEFEESGRGKYLSSRWTWPRPSERASQPPGAPIGRFLADVFATQPKHDHIPKLDKRSDYWDFRDLIRMNSRPKYKKTKRIKKKRRRRKKTRWQKKKEEKPKREFHIVMSGQLCTPAMFFLPHLFGLFQRVFLYNFQASLQASKLR